MYTKRQQEIIQSAIALIAEKGIQQLTIKKLAAKVGVTEGAIYRHFDSKLDILMGILSLFEKSSLDLTEHIRKFSGEPHRQLKIIFEEHFREFQKNPAVASVIFSEELFRNESRLSELVYKIMQHKQKTLETIIQDGQKEGLFREDVAADQLALLFMGALRLTVTRWRLAQFSFDLKKEGERLWEAIQSVIQKPE